MWDNFFEVVELRPLIWGDYVDFADYLNRDLRGINYYVPNRHCEVRSNREQCRADLYSASASVRLLRSSQ
jgi:hypothetical protein